MVLRGADRATGMLVFYTDVRAAKVADLAANPRVAVTAYDPATRLQMRLYGEGTVATSGGPVDLAWAALSASGRAAYQSIESPGTPVARPPTAPAACGDGGRARFAVITMVLDRFDWLDLAIPGHRRALHVRDGAVWSGSWLVP